jgi:hypothetical protein
MNCLKVHALVFSCCTPQPKQRGKKMKKVPKVCMCDGMPYLHNYSSGCNTEDGYVAFKPTDEEKYSQTHCLHDGNDDNTTFEGVCSGCGKMVDEKEAAKWAK